MRGKLIGMLAVVLLGAFLSLLMRIATLPLESGEAYPAYSSLRADPRGTMALYESLAALGDFKVARNFQPLPNLRGSTGTVLLLGLRGDNAEAWGEQELKFYESLANEGARLVIGFMPEPPAVSPAPKKTPEAGPKITSRWHVSLAVREGTREQVEAAGALPRETSLYFTVPPDSGWTGNASLIERGFGKGRIVLLSETYPLSNEGLRARQDIDLIRVLIGPPVGVIFDETHLGVSNSGSIGTLIRRYRLTGTFAVVLLLGLLFLWKNSTSLLPPAEESAAAVAQGADARAGLVNLLKRSIPAERLTQECWERWKETRPLGRPVSDTRVALAEREIALKQASYEKIRHILTEKT